MVDLNLIPEHRQSEWVQAPRKWSHDFDNSQVELQESGEYRDWHLNAERSEDSVDDMSELFAKKGED
jgi:hypothetical protein